MSRHMKRVFKDFSYFIKSFPYLLFISHFKDYSAVVRLCTIVTAACCVGNSSTFATFTCGFLVATKTPHVGNLVRVQISNTYKEDIV
jgi:hypothetical protein